MSDRESQVRRVQVGLIRGINSSVIDPQETDEELLHMYGESSRPLAEALHGVLVELAVSSSAPSQSR